jgi:hypothetical protein
MGQAIMVNFTEITARGADIPKGYVGFNRGTKL